MVKRKTVTVHFEDLFCDTGFNSRVDYDNINELAESIKQHGLLQNIGVTEKKGEPGKYFVIYGFRRYAALTKIRAELGPDAFSELEVMLNEGTVDELRERNLKENIDREQLKPHEIATAIKKMVNAGLEQRDIGTRLGRPQSWVSYHYKAATKLAPTAWRAFREGNITLEQALHIADVPEETQGDIVNKILGAETRSEARQIAKKAAESSGSRRTYTNKGRPTVKNLSQYVSDASFDASSSVASDEDRLFYNGLAAGIRVAIGDLEFGNLTSATTYTDVEYLNKGKETAASKGAAEPKKRGRPAKTKPAAVKGSAVPKKRGRPPKAKA